MLGKARLAAGVGGGTCLYKIELSSHHFIIKPRPRTLHSVPCLLTLNSQTGNFSASVKSVSLFTTEEVCHPVNCYTVTITQIYNDKPTKDQAVFLHICKINVFDCVRINAMRTR